LDPYRHITAFCLEHPWAITRAMLQTVAGILAARIAGRHASEEDLQAALKQRDKLPQPTGGAVAVIPIHGVLVPRGNLLSDMSGATSLDVLTGQIRDAVAMDAVKTIVLDVDSPGGSVAGASELAREIMKARTKKPVIAVAQYTMASCAYWLAAAATEIVAAPSAIVGSIGVYTMHQDLSKALEEMGIKRTYIFAGKHKVDGNETEPLTDDVRKQLQQRVDESYGRMVADISRGRGVPVSDVRSGYAEGNVVGADEALALKMIDRIETLDETVARVASVAPSRAMREAATDPTPSPLADTSQEPSQATDQDRVSDLAFRTQFERALFEMQL
jgi:signal peptide peptidase SppA